MNHHESQSRLAGMPGASANEAARENEQPEKAWYWNKFWYSVHVWRELRSITDPERYRQAMYGLLDDNGLRGFNIRVCCVASLGFLASSYSLFATSILWPALNSAYARNVNAAINTGEVFDLVTLGGIITGMIVFGHLADRVGRKSLYGLELLIIIFATFGIAFSSDGFGNSLATDGSDGSQGDFPKEVSDVLNSNPLYTQTTMNVFTGVTTWRFVLGLGIGAEYPMSAIIAAEFVSTQSRGTTLAIVFFMQSLGRIMAFGFGNLFLLGQLNASAVAQISDGRLRRLATKFVVDRTWRFVAAFGGVFAVIAIALRLTIPESPRYNVSIMGDIRKATAPTVVHNASDTREHAAPDFVSKPREDTRDESPKWIVGAWRYLSRDGNWKPVAMMCILWFLLDLCFYSAGLDSPSTLNMFWPSLGNSTDLIGENRNITNDDIAADLQNNGDRVMEIFSSASLAGSFAVILLINCVSRRLLLLSTSLALCLTFFITGALIKTRANNRAVLGFYGLAQFLFNLGPNTIIFVLAAEVFPAMFRGTFYGLAAAAGKAAAMAIRHAAQYATDQGLAANPNLQPLMALHFAFGSVMLVIAGLAWFRPWLPEVQYPRQRGMWRLANIHLEDITPRISDGQLAKVPKGNTIGHVDPLEGHRYPPPPEEIAMDDVDAETHGRGGGFDQSAPGWDYSNNGGPQNRWNGY